MPMVPPAPPTFSTMMVWPNVRDMWSPRRRVTTSVGPPAANGTMTVIGLSGNGAGGGQGHARMAPPHRNHRRVGVAAITDAGGTDFAAAHRLKQQPSRLRHSAKT